jgi:hypothetical protein
MGVRIGLAVLLPPRPLLGPGYCILSDIFIINRL